MTDVIDPAAVDAARERLSAYAKDGPNTIAYRGVMGDFSHAVMADVAIVLQALAEYERGGQLATAKVLTSGLDERIYALEVLSEQQAKAIEDAQAALAARDEAGDAIADLDAVLETADIAGIAVFDSNYTIRAVGYAATPDVSVVPEWESQGPTLTDAILALRQAVQKGSEG